MVKANTLNIYYNSKSSKLIIYNINNQDIIQFIEEDLSYILSSEIKDSKHKLYDFVIKPSNIKRRS
jgi:hypothetical protein